MRGKDVDALGSVCRLGITPAYAGKRDGDDAVLACFWDHPRVCGEKGLLSYKIDQTQGSPPRMRGKVHVCRDSIATTGITPAYAGKSRMGQHQHDRYQDHPRVCGEKYMTIANDYHAKGSPPRMRGKVSSKRPDAHTRGITPAYAGKSEELTREVRKHKDHPRVCGEKCRQKCEVRS